MPMQQGSNAIFNKLNKKFSGIIKKHAADEPQVSGGRLPGGITNGVGKLIDAQLGEVAAGKQNAGEPYLRLSGTVVEPFTVVDPATKQTVAVRGMQTSVIFMLCDTKNKDNVVTSGEQNMVRAMDHLKILGAPAELFDGDVDGFRDAIEAVKEASPYFRFSTELSQPKTKDQQPRVFENWHGCKGLEGYEEPAAPGEKVVDETAPAAKAPSRNGTAPTPVKAANPKPVGRTPAKVAEPESEGDAGDVDMGDLDSLVERADADDVKAQQQLTAIALKAGVSPKDVDAARNWTQVRELIEASSQGAGAEESGEDEGVEEGAEEGEATEFVPEKGNVYFYRPLDPKTKKPGKRKVEVEVVLVNKADKTCSVKNLDDGKVVKGLAFDRIEEGE